MKRRIAPGAANLSMILILLIGGLLGCASQQTSPAPGSAPAATSTPAGAKAAATAPASGSPTAKAAASPQASNTSANKTSDGPGASGATREVVDMAGRKVTVPRDIKKVFTTHAVGAIFLYTLAPDALIGWNTPLSPGTKKYLLPKQRDLPNLGGWGNSVNANTEEILKIHPDVIISMEGMNEQRVAMADKIQEQLGIPVLMLDNKIDKLADAYEFMGGLLGVESRAKELAAFSTQTVKEVREKIAQIPAEKRVSVYYAEGSKGLETDPKGSPHVEVLDLAGAVNIADVGEKGLMGRSPVSLEQVLSWDPEVIISWNAAQGGYYPGILSDPSWQTIKAVSSRRVYEIPDAPFSWFDRPPSSNRLLGVKWLASKLYPDAFKYDMVKEAKGFYKQFYHYDLSDAEADTLLKGTPR